MLALLLLLRVVLALVLAAAATNATVQLTIVHINDNHARFEPASTSFGPCTNPVACFGGFPRMTAAIKAARAAAAAAGQDILVLHAGDQFQGTPWDYVYAKVGNTTAAAAFLNLIGLDAFTPGNHEFDYRPAVLGSFIDNLNTSVTSCNIDASAEPALAGKIKPYVLRTLPVSGAKVAIIGLTTPETSQSSSPGPNVKFTDPATALPSCVAAAKAAGAVIIIALTHIGAPLDLTIAASAAAADVDLIIGGHSHTLFYTGSVPKLLVSPSTDETTPVAGLYPVPVPNGARTVPYVQALWASRYLGSLQASFSSTGDYINSTGNPILLGGANSSNPVSDDPAAAALLASLRGPVDALNNQPAGSTTVYLTGPVGEPNTTDALLVNPVRMRETNLGNLFGDALLWWYKNATSLPSDPSLAGLPVAAISNGGGIRASLPAGALTVGNVVSLSPFGNWAVVKRVRAADVVASLANGVSLWANKGTPGGRFPQVAGLKYVFTSNSSGSGGTLNRAFLADGRELGVNYTGDVILIVNNFMGIAPAGDGYTLLGNAPTLLDSSTPLDWILTQYVAAFSPLAPKVEGRIFDLSSCRSLPAATCPTASMPLVGLAARASSVKATTFRKPTPRRNNGTASLALDGQLNTFVLTSSAKGAWFEVDLGKTVALASVTLVAPTLAAGEKWPVTYSADDSFVVRLSAAPANATGPPLGPGVAELPSLAGPLPASPGATLAALPPNGTRYPTAQQGPRAAPSNPTLQGRYVSVQVRRTNKRGALKDRPLSLAEIQVATVSGFEG